MPIYMELPPAEITVSAFNPTRRVDRTRLTGLLLSIREHGILTPLALTYNRELADGHRRHAAAQLLKLPTVPVAIYTENKLDAPTLWVVLNSDTMNLTPSQWLAAVDAGLPMTTPGFPEPLKRRIERLQELVGKEGVSELVEQNRSPYLLDNASRVANYCGRKGDEEFFKVTVRWLVSAGNSFSVRNLMTDDIPVDVLEEAIEHGAEITRMWGVSSKSK